MCHQMRTQVSGIGGAVIDTHSLAERLAVWADEARAAGRIRRADALLFQAWRAYDAPRPSDGPAAEPTAPSRKS